MNVQFVRIGYIPSTSSGNPHIARKHLDKKKYGTTEVTDVPTNKKIADKIAPHIPSALRDLGVILYKYILSRGTILAGAGCAGTE